MSTPFDRVIIGDVVTSEAIIRNGYVAVRGETIAAIGQDAPPPATEIADHSGKLILPGLVDGHMHTSSSTGWAGIETATMSAAAGGVTTCCDMPYDVPHPVTDAALLADKIGWVERTAHVDLALYGTITKTGLPVSIHNEDQELVELLTARARAAGRTEPIMHCRTRPPLAETMADLEIFEMALETGAHVHIAHSSLARGFEIAETFRNMGAQASGEACIQYLCMTEDDIVRLAGKGKCNPPFRTAAEVERMWQCLQEDKIAYVSTDHAPWPLERKTLPDIFACGAGLTGLQSFAPLIFTLLDERGLSPTLMATYCAERSARLHGLWPKKGAIRLGSDADLCVLECGNFTFDEALIQDRPEMRWSPYHGRTMRARVAATYLRGTLVWNGTAVLAKPGSGRFVRRLAN